MRRLGVVAVALAVVLVPGAALAAWSAAGDGAASSRAAALPKGQTPSASASGRDVTVTWDQSSVRGSFVGALSGGGYVVTRYPESGSGGGVAATGACAGVVGGSGARLSCVESAVPGGRWRYAVTPALGAWRGPESDRGAVVAVGPRRPDSVVLANGGGQGNAYVNLANRAAVAVDVSLPAASSLTDAVHARLTAPNGASATRTAPATDGAGTVRISNIDATSLQDGTVTLEAWVTTLAGDASDTTTATAPKDTAAPAAPSAVALTNGGGQGNAYVNLANRASVDFAVQLGAGSSSFDAIALRVTDLGDVHVVNRGAGATQGAGTVAFAGLDLSAFLDGNVVAAATSRDVAGNTSAAASLTRQKDTLAPIVTLDCKAVGARPRPATCTGTATDAGAVAITIYNGAGTGGTVFQTISATPNAAGAFSATTNNLTRDAAYTGRAVQTDAAGNPGTSNTSSFTG